MVNKVSRAEWKTCQADCLNKNKNVLRLNVNESRVTFREGEEGYYSAVQAGLLTPLTFAWHCISPLAAFTSSAYFLHNRRW